MINFEQCRCCRNDFYNGKNTMGIKRCWSANSGELVTRYRIGVHTLLTSKGAFTKVKIPNCYHRDGYAFYSKIPDFVRASNLNRVRRAVSL